MIITPSRTTPLYAGTSVTLTCTATLHPNVDNGENVKIGWTGPNDLSGKRYSLTDHESRSTYTYTLYLTISPLVIGDDNNRYSCSVTVDGRSGVMVNQTTSYSNISIDVKREQSVYLNIFFHICVVSLFPYSSSTTTCDHISCQWFSHCWAALLPRLLCGGSTTSCGGPWYTVDQAGW